MDLHSFHGFHLLEELVKHRCSGGPIHEFMAGIILHLFGWALVQEMLINTRLVAKHTSTITTNGDISRATEIILYGSTSITLLQHGTHLKRLRNVCSPSLIIFTFQLQLLTECGDQHIIRQIQSSNSTI